MEIGKKIQRLRKQYGLTIEELANRTELSKSFISQLERDLTSPSIATLVDILECLGTNLQDFFSEKQQEKVVFSPADMFEQVDEQRGWRITWLIPNAQKNRMEPIEITLQPGCSTEMDDPHEGEEFGYLLSGSASLCLGESVYRLRKGDTFCYTPSSVHGIKNTGKSVARILWVSTPPSF